MNSSNIPSPPRRAHIRCGSAVILLLLTMARSVDTIAAEPEWIMDRDPLLRMPEFVVKFPPGLAELWLDTLHRPERDLRRRIISSIALAHQRGLPGLEAAIQPLMQIVESPDQDRALRLTAARTLIVLDAKQAASVLFRSCEQRDLDMAELVEPALIRWKYEPMRNVWLDRLAREEDFRRMDVLAIRGLTAFGESKSVPRLRELARQSHRPSELRLEAATSLGVLQKSGLENLARQLIKDKSRDAVVDRLVAARMLAGHRGKDAEQVLSELATDVLPVVQAIALRHLVNIDPKLIMPSIEATVTSEDAKVRRIAAEALLALPSQENVGQIGSLLDDPNPGLRRFVCDSLIEMAKDTSLDDTIVAQGRRMLDADGWRGQEQATLLLVALDDKFIVERLLELLAAERAEVHTTAAWGLSRLDDRNTAQKIFEVFQTKTELELADLPRQRDTYVQLSHLAQALGKMKFKPAETVLRKYIPKSSPLHPTTRAASIWALGHLHAGEPQDALADQLCRRLMDIKSLTPEADTVRRMAAVAIGRMKATQKLPDLRAMLQMDVPGNGGAGYACAWAIHHMTGEPLPDIQPTVFWENQWFLVPAGPHKQ